ncbi:MAG TPA: hypothetical protein VNU68_03385 [Verrucomicrobiae bacterium]|nr:hypothetical protein [Verrucomicrobiae bacterium]
MRPRRIDGARLKRLYARDRRCRRFSIIPIDVIDREAGRLTDFIRP